MLQEPDIQRSVLEKIRAGGVSMHSRAYFALRAVLAGAIALCVFAGALFVLSFAFFSVRASDVRFLLEFGEQGLATYVTVFPWLSFLLALALLLAFEFVVRRFTSAYRFPLLRIFLWILVVGTLGSMLIGLTPLHASLLSAADNNQLPVLGSLYEQMHDSHVDRGVYRGDIVSIAESYFVMAHNDTDRDSDEGSWNIVPPAGFNLRTLSVGEKVYVAGRLRNGVVYAYGVRPLPDGE